MHPRITTEYNRTSNEIRRKMASLVKKTRFSTIACGLKNIVTELTIDIMKREDPTRTAMPISIPSISEPDAAVIDERTSEAPAPKARIVTPASDSESRNV